MNPCFYENYIYGILNEITVSVVGGYYMKNIILFLATLIKEVQEDELIPAANELTYKIILALFPFIIFLLTLIGYMELDTSLFMNKLYQGLPAELAEIFSVFVKEVLAVKRPSLLSTSLIFTLFSASSGFNSVMRGIHKAYGIKDSRFFLKQRAVSMILVLLFALLIALSMVMLVFNNHIYVLLTKYLPESEAFKYIFSFMGYFVTILFMLSGVMLINKLALSKKTSFKSLLPGGLFTVILWLIASGGFNMYVSNFSRYSAVYGSLAGIILLMVWLNIISTVLLLGSEINAMLEVK
jgi:membrane protein